MLNDNFLAFYINLIKVAICTYFKLFYSYCFLKLVMLAILNLIFILFQNLI